MDSSKILHWEKGFSWPTKILLPQKNNFVVICATKLFHHDNWLKDKNIIQTQKMAKKCPKNSKFLV